MRALTVSAIAVTIAAVALWGITVADVWAQFLSLRAVSETGRAAVMLGIGAFVCWVGRFACVRHCAELPGRDDAYLAVIDRLTARRAREGRRHLTRARVD